MIQQRDYDLAALTLHLGGPRLLYAHSKGQGLPSLSTTYRNSHYPTLSPSVSFPTISEILSNIQALFALPAASTSPKDPKTLAPKLRGFSLLTDEISLEERPEFCAFLDALIGFCREHSMGLPLTNISSHPLESLEAIRKALEAGTCHLAKEATVVALAPFGSEDYSARVVLMSGTCKTESDMSHYELLKLVIEAWNSSPHGAVTHGPLWSLATDGEGRRRRAIHYYCYSSALATDSPLYAYLGALPLLNLCCGPHEETNDSDYKHLEKRLASALRKSSGILVAHTHIDSSLIQYYIGKLPGVSSSSIDLLFDNSDHQNVPKAYRLLSLTYQASTLGEVTSAPENRALVLLGQLLWSFVSPFTELSFSLSQQLTALSMCGHLLFVLYQMNRSDFISGQLYYDMQSAIKNAYFCVAKTRVLDPELPFYLLQCGDDRLENRFGTLRTMTHDTNMDLLQLAERSASAQHIDQIYARNPDLHRAPYRLSATGSAGVDHTNPRSWTGNVLVKNVDLETTWIDGKKLALQALATAGISFDFDKVAKAYPGRAIDLMRPFGEYIGLRESTIGEDDPASAMEVGCSQSIVQVPGASPQSQPLESQQKKDKNSAAARRKFWVDMEGHWLH
ncbi:hypothetical protein FRC09_018382, partial [Ceratobasidium sp. 395]